ncbi:MAG: hypothetical protein IAE91_04685 [Ignavibacteriaceae bacterium]|nr:hypothetical protein [Ignavibacteriaceae bacterium]
MQHTGFKDGLRVFDSLRSGVEYTLNRKESFYFNYRVTPLNFRKRSIRVFDQFVDLPGLSCSCTDFKINDGFLFPKNSLSKMCKHLLKSLLQFADLSRLDFLIIEQTFKFGFEKYIKEEIGNTKVLFGITGLNELRWVNVYLYSIQGENANRFSYNIPENRWAFGGKPDNAELIEKCLKYRLNKIATV